MELKQPITKFTYRIEPKPEGGFMANATAPTAPPLEAPTREELQRKIQETIFAGLNNEFPGLKLPTADSKELKFAFHIETKPGGGFVIHSADPNAKPVEGANHEEIENLFAEKLLGFVGKHFMPDLSKLLAAQGGTGDIKVFVNNKTFSVKTNAAAAGVAQAFLPAGLGQMSSTTVSGTTAGTQQIQNQNPDDLGRALVNTPINPESSKITTVVRVVLTLLFIAAAAIYFLIHHR